MVNNSDITFQDTIEWATLKSEGKIPPSRGIPIFYLIIGSVILLILTILFIYLIGRKSEKSEVIGDDSNDPIEMMRDDKNTQPKVQSQNIKVDQHQSVAADPDSVNEDNQTN